MNRPEASGEQPTDHKSVDERFRDLIKASPGHLAKVFGEVAREDGDGADLILLANDYVEARFGSTPGDPEFGKLKESFLAGIAFHDAREQTEDFEAWFDEPSPPNIPSPEAA